MRAIRLLIVDDHPVVRDGLSGMFAGDPDFEVLGQAADGAQAVDLAERLGPDVCSWTCACPAWTASARSAEIARSAASPRGCWCSRPTTPTATSARDRGRRDRLPAQGRAARRAAPGRARRGARRVGALAVGRQPRVLGQVRRRRSDALSQRELEVLELVARGTTNREAAERLFISEATVKTHLLHIYAKLGVNDRAAAVATAFERGLLSPKRNDRR